MVLEDAPTHGHFTFVSVNRLNLRDNLEIDFDPSKPSHSLRSNFHRPPRRTRSITMAPSSHHTIASVTRPATCIERRAQLSYESERDAMPRIEGEPWLKQPRAEDAFGGQRRFDPVTRTQTLRIARPSIS